MIKTIGINVRYINNNDQKCSLVSSKIVEKELSCWAAEAGNIIEILIVKISITIMINVNIVKALTPNNPNMNPTIKPNIKPTSEIFIKANIN